MTTFYVGIHFSKLTHDHVLRQVSIILLEKRGSLIFAS